MPEEHETPGRFTTFAIVVHISYYNSVGVADFLMEIE